MRASRFSSVVGALAAALACACAPQPNAGSVTVLRDFTLIDGTGGAPVANAALVIEDGKVSWVGADAEVEVPAGAESVDLAGKYVMPGLIDLHAHVGIVRNVAQSIDNYTRENVARDLRTYAAYGVTTVQTLGTDADLAFDIIAEQRAGRPQEARLFSGGQGVVFRGGYGGVPGLNQPVADAAAATAFVDAQVAHGASLIKLWVDDEHHTMPAMPAAISQAAIDAAHAQQLPAIAHIFYLRDAETLVAQGVDGFGHSVRDQPVDAALAEAMRAGDAWMMSATLSREAYFVAYRARAPFLDDPFFRYGATAEDIAVLESPEFIARFAGSPQANAYPTFLATAMANLKTLADAGVRIGMGTDSGPPGRFAGYSAHWELALMVEAGLTPGQAIHAATGSAAEFLRADDLGTLAPGKWADLVVLNADPLANILNTRAIDAVYIAGAPVEAARVSQ